ncbi:MAG TPA: hypothetical protein VFE59_18995 [Trebonia sp.]|nr:hypothetical protein [Trebonia sp.]
MHTVLAATPGADGGPGGRLADRAVLPEALAAPRPDGADMLEIEHAGALRAGRAREALLR